MAEESKQAARPAPEPVPVDETSIAATYANFCRVTGTPEELIVDFGLNNLMKNSQGEYGLKKVLNGKSAEK